MQLGILLTMHNYDSTQGADALGEFSLWDWLYSLNPMQVWQSRGPMTGSELSFNSFSNNLSKYRFLLACVASSSASFQ